MNQELMCTQDNPITRYSEQIEQILKDYQHERLSPHHLILLSGLSGVGKTTWCLELVGRAQQRGLNPVGLVSPAIFKNDVKVAIDIMDIQSGKKRRLARRQFEHRQLNPDGSVTPQWALDETALTWGNQILANLRHAQQDTLDILIIDEMGWMEWEKGAGLVRGMQLIDERRYRLAVVPVRSRLLENAVKRWPWAYSYLLDLSKTSN
jgi:nucleoside-triphosphatase THEP1